MTRLPHAPSQVPAALFPLRSALILLAFGLAGCTTSPTATNGNNDDIIHHHWWNYYERAIKRMQAGDFPAAQSDLERCLGVKSGAVYGWDEDAWRVRTYGLHFEEDFFPNRELGVCLLKAGQPQQAIPYLEKSLQQTPSGRAKEYLNRARRALLARGTPPPPPQVEVDEACLSLWTKERTRSVKGKAKAPGWVSHFAVNGNPEFLELAEQTRPFRADVALHSGTNTIALEAGDLLGQRTVRNITWIADWQPPVLQIHDFRRDGADWVLTGECVDDAALVSVSAGGQDFFHGAPQQRQKTVPVAIRLHAGIPTLLIAEDAAGNRLQVNLSPDTFEQQRIASLPRPAYASLNAQASPSDLPAAGNPAPAATAAAPDTLPPTLRLSEDRAIAYSFAEEFFLDGHAADSGGLAALTVNGENLLEDAGKGIKRTYFSRRLPLQLGTNRFEIVARDLAGNQTAKSIAVVRGTPEYLDEEYRLTVGIPPVLSPQPLSAGILVKQAMERELTRQPVRFRVLEREEGWDYILREQKLSASDLADPSAALKIGKMLPAEILLMARLLTQAGGTTIFLRGVETGNGEVVFSDDVYSEALDKELDDLVGGLTMKIKQRFPLVMTGIVRVSGSEATIGAGRDQGIEPGARFIVIPKSGSVTNTPTGEVTKQDGKWVELAVRKVGRDTGVTGILPASAAKSVRNGDTAYAR